MYHYSNVSINRLTLPAYVASSVFDDNGAKLMSAGWIRDAAHVSRLREHGIASLLVRKSAPETHHIRAARRQPAGVVVTVPSNDTVDGNEGLLRCDVCLRYLPLSYPDTNLEVHPWVCCGCGTVFFASCRDDFAATDAEDDTPRPQVQIARLHLTPQVTTKASPAMQRFIEKLEPEGYTGPERRAYARHEINVPVVCVPLGGSFQIVADPFEARTHNISATGICLLHTRHVEQPYLALDLSEAAAQPMQVVMQLSRSRSAGIYYEIAGPFVSRFSPQ